MNERGTIARRVSDQLRADIASRWSLWTWICVVGCSLSLAVLKARGNLFARRSNFSGVDFVALCALGLGFLAGLVALTRRGTSRVAPGVALLIVLVVGRLETLGALMALAEVPFVVLGYLIRHL